MYKIIGYTIQPIVLEHNSNIHIKIKTTNAAFSGPQCITLHESCVILHAAHVPIMWESAKFFHEELHTDKHTACISSFYDNVPLNEKPQSAISISELMQLIRLA